MCDSTLRPWASSSASSSNRRDTSSNPTRSQRCRTSSLRPCLIISSTVMSQPVKVTVRSGPAWRSRMMASVSAIPSRTNVRRSTRSESARHGGSRSSNGTVGPMSAFGPSARRRLTSRAISLLPAARCATSSCADQPSHAVGASAGVAASARRNASSSADAGSPVRPTKRTVGRTVVRPQATAGAKGVGICKGMRISLTKTVAAVWRSSDIAVAAPATASRRRPRRAPRPPPPTTRARGVHHAARRTRG